MVDGKLENIPIVTQIGYISCKQMLELMIYGKTDLLSQPIAYFNSPLRTCCFLYFSPNYEIVWNSFLQYHFTL